MTKAEMIEAILNDMYIKSNTKKAEIDKRFKGWLNRQNKKMVEEIFQNRGLK